MGCPRVARDAPASALELLSAARPSIGQNARMADPICLNSIDGGGIALDMGRIGYLPRRAALRGRVPRRISGAAAAPPRRPACLSPSTLIPRESRLASCSSAPPGRCLCLSLTYAGPGGPPPARPPARRRFSSRPARLCLCSRPSSPVRPATNCLSLTRMFFFSRDCFCTPRSPEARQSSFPFLSPLSPLSPLDRVPAWCVCWLSSFRVSALKETHLCVCAELASS